MRAALPPWFPSLPRGVVGTATSVLMLLPGGASAFCVYNQSASTANARVNQGDFSSDIGANGDACCHWSNKGCNPSGSQDAMLTTQIELGSFNCTVGMQAGGYAILQQEDRSRMGLPPNYYCTSYDKNNQLVSASNTYGLGATTRDVRFLATADPQYENGRDNSTANQTLATMLNQVRNSAQVRGLLIAGDLTQNTRPNDEFSWYKSAISGLSRFVYDGLGNHDVADANDGQKAACFFGTNACVDPDRLRSDIADRKRATVKTFGSGPHYSWDWQDVHFVQLNLFPGNSTVAEQYSQGSPQNSLAFLQLDLALFVGKSGRPVVLMHHYGFDNFSTGKTGELWWTDAQRSAYWDVIASYNVAGIFAGHIHLDASSQWKVPFQRPADRSTGPDSIPTFVSGAAKNGAYLDARFDQDVFRVTRKDQYGTAQPGDAVFAVRGNLAFRKPTQQSSTHGSADAARAVDGRTDGTFANGSVSHTQLDTFQPWWQVDLQSVQQVGDVVLYNRTDCCAERLRDFNLLVSEDGSSWQAFAHPGTAGAQVSVPVNRAARYVKVQLNGPGTLSLAEVQVLPQTNLAVGKPATQSSTYGTSDASRAVDGRTDGHHGNGSVTHTLGDSQPWWQVDLQSVQQVGDVVLYNRTDCCTDRLSDFTVLVSEDGWTWQPSVHPGTAGARVSIPVNRAARYVKVQLNGSGILNLAEVQVFAQANLALGKPATQSSTYETGDASRAVDGRTQGTYGNGSVTHTQSGTQPWWQVDLQAVKQLDRVVLFNRTDCCKERLSNFSVLLSTDGATWQAFAYPGTAGDQVTLPVRRAARYVKVQLNGTGMLSLAEVQVFAQANLASNKSAQQSSTLEANAEAAKALDGNTDGDASHGSVSHTHFAVQPWWQVDLRSSRRLGDVVIHNRTDCCSERLSDFNVLVSEDGATWQAYAHPGVAAPRVSIPVNRAARYVKVQLQGTTHLSLAEVEVFERP